MDQKEIRSIVQRALLDVAPDLEGMELKEDEPLREIYDVDSADYLNFIIRIHELLGIDIPEGDYPKLTSLGSAVAYLSQRGVAKNGEH